MAITITRTILGEMADKVAHSMTEATIAIPEEEGHLVEIIKILIIPEETGDKGVHLTMEVSMVTPEVVAPLVEIIKIHILREETEGKGDHSIVGITIETLREEEEDPLVIGTNILVMIVPILTLELMLDQSCLLSFLVLYSVTH